MEDEFEDLVRWFSLNTRAGEIISAEALPDDVDIDGIDWLENKSELRKLLDKVQMPPNYSYDLGTVTTGTFLMQSSASHRIERNADGTRWKMYVSGPDFPKGEECMGEVDSDIIMTEVEDLKYEVSLRNWISMGWRPSK